MGPARTLAASGRRVRLLQLLEPQDSVYAARIDQAASDAGLSISHLDNLEAIPPDSSLIGIGPSVRDPLYLARHLRNVETDALLVFFAASSSARDALRAELVRDPFLYPRYELIEVPGNVRQLASRMGTVVARFERQLHDRRAARRSRRRWPTANSRPPGANGEDLNRVIEHAADAIFAIDRTGHVLTWNPASQRLFGFTPQAAVGQPIDFLKAPSADGHPQTHLGEVVRRVIASNETDHTLVACTTSAGEVVQASVSVAPLCDRDGTMIGATVIARDDSEYQRVQEAVRRANRQKDEFLAIMSHELRTPLTSILGYTDMLLRGLSGPLPPLTSKYVGNVRMAGDRLLELVNGLLDYTRLESGAERLEVRPVDLSRLVGQTVQQCQAQARNKSIELRLAIAKGVAARIEADEEKLVHVLRSYIGNALKFTPNGGYISVHVGPDQETRDRVRVTVVDSGIGMADEQIKRVWERFYQGDASLTRAYGGMGLGLSIARHLVLLHGGSVGAESSGPGRGSTFWFTLPLRHAS